MAPDIEKVRQWWERDPSTAIQRYESGLRAPNGPNEATEMGDSRRKVSQYFLRVRALCQKEMLDADLVATTLGAEPVQVFLLYVDPLDEVVCRVAGKAHNTAERNYSGSYLKRHFNAIAVSDPWGLRGEVRMSECE